MYYNGMKGRNGEEEKGRFRTQDNAKRETRNLKHKTRNDKTRNDQVVVLLSLYSFKSD